MWLCQQIGWAYVSNFAKTSFTIKNSKKRISLLCNLVSVVIRSPLAGLSSQFFHSFDFFVWFSIHLCIRLISWTFQQNVSSAPRKSLYVNFDDDSCEKLRAKKDDNLFYWRAKEGLVVDTLIRLSIESISRDFWFELTWEVNIIIFRYLYRAKDGQGEDKM